VIDESDLRSAVDRQWQDVEPAARAAAQDIWSHPELGLMERYGGGVLCDWLEREGFRVERGVAGLPTCFVARYGEGEPSVGFLAEYDALPALSNSAEPHRHPLVKGGPGHGCGHNLIGAGNTAAAISVSRAMRDTGLPGTVLVFGTPAEEIVFGKLVMNDAGVFAAADVLLTHHADYFNAALARPCQSIIQPEFAFLGRPQHTGVTRPQNANDAAELLLQIVERLRAHQFPDVSVEHVVRYPAICMPSATPEEARVWFYLRTVDYQRAEQVLELITEQAEHAARSTGVTMRRAIVSACHGYLPNDVLAERIFRAYRHVGPPAWEEPDRRFMSELSQAFGGPAELDLDDGVSLLSDGYDAYGQDDGEVSWSVPLGRCNWACPVSIPLHSWAATALFGTETGWKGAAVASRTLAQAGADLLRTPALVAGAQAELSKRAAGSLPSRRGDFAPIISDPEAFWTGRWSL
jgi:aminobenzoyl-glutamate utilization protein B